jgi:Ricin-type beta-trefoil lectin domain
MSVARYSAVFGALCAIVGCHGKSLFNDANNAPIHGANLLIHSAKNEEMCIDAENSKAELSPLVQLIHCHGRENQRWTFADQNDGSSQILGIGGLCLDVQGQHSSTGTPLQLYPCGGATNQKFRHNIDGRLQEMQTGKCLTVSDFVEKSPVFIDDCREKKPGQVWVVSPR